MSTPQQGKNKQVFANSPGGGKYKQSFALGAGGRFFQPITPDRLRVNLPHEEDKKKYFCATEERLSFRVTRQTIQTRQGKRRLALSQKSLTKSSAREIFTYHGLDQNKLSSSRPTGNKHLAHIIGFILGGDHEHHNIIPATAESNYATRDSIELFIMNKLLNHETDEIFMDVDIGFEKGIDIPIVLHYHLQWQEIQNGIPQDIEETITIYPRSETRFDNTKRATLALARKLSFESQTDLSSENTLVI